MTQPYCARGILPTLPPLFSRCCVALFLDYDGTGGGAAYTRLSLFLCIVGSYPPHSLSLSVSFTLSLSLFLLSSYGIPRVSSSCEHLKRRQMFARTESVMSRERSRSRFCESFVVKMRELSESVSNRSNGMMQRINNAKVYLTLEQLPTFESSKLFQVKDGKFHYCSSSSNFSTSPSFG